MIIREISQIDTKELELVAERCVATVLETISEFGGSQDLAQKTLGKFSSEHYSAMIKNDFTDPSKRIMIAEADGSIVGHNIYSVKLDESHNRFGFCFTLYVEPLFRKSGI